MLDSHQHFWDIQRFDYGWLTPKAGKLYRNYLPADLAPCLRAAGVTRTIFVQAMSGLVENDFAIELAAANPFIAGIVGWADLFAPDIDDVLARYAARPGFVGVRSGLDARCVTDGKVAPELQRGLKALANHNLTLDVLAWKDSLAMVPAVADAEPSLRIVIDHMAGTPVAEGADAALWRQRISDAARRANVVCKVSGLITQAPAGKLAQTDFRPHVAHAVEVFSTQRLMFGSDWPVCLLGGEYVDALGVIERSLGALSAGERRRVMGDNAARVYLGGVARGS